MLRAMFDRLGRKPAISAIAPAQPFWAIGDIHGCADLLDAALQRAKDHPVVCVGDFVDRGDRSADVLRMLFSRPDVACLSGNHEEMMLRFIDQPEDYGRMWLRYGGINTLASFGTDAVDENSDLAAIKAARDQLITAMGQPMLEWLRSLPGLWRSGNVAVVHAGADPRAGMENQTPTDLLWGHPHFFKRTRQDGIWVVHGHTIVDAPQVKHGRIAIDTGAYATGRLTLAFVETGSVTFETVHSSAWV